MTRNILTAWQRVMFTISGLWRLFCWLLSSNNPKPMPPAVNEKELDYLVVDALRDMDADEGIKAEAGIRDRIAKELSTKAKAELLAKRKELIALKIKNIWPSIKDAFSARALRDEIEIVRYDGRVIQHVVQNLGDAPDYRSGVKVSWGPGVIYVSPSDPYPMKKPGYTLEDFFAYKRAMATKKVKTKKKRNGR